MSISLLYRNLASRACSSFNAYIAIIPGVASGILVSTRETDGRIVAADVATKAYLDLPAGRIIHSRPLGALALMDSGSSAL